MCHRLGLNVDELRRLQRPRGRANEASALRTRYTPPHVEAIAAHLINSPIEKMRKTLRYLTIPQLMIGHRVKQRLSFSPYVIFVGDRYRNLPTPTDEYRNTIVMWCLMKRPKSGSTVTTAVFKNLKSDPHLLFAGDTL